MSIDLTGITNKNEYYTNHYFSTIFEENASEAITVWTQAAQPSEEDRTPRAHLRQYSRQLYPLHDRYASGALNLQLLAAIRTMADRYLASLGYPEAVPELVPVDTALSVPVYLEMKKSNGAPLLWVMLSASRESDAGILESNVFDGSIAEEDAFGAVHSADLLELKNEQTKEHPLLLRWYYGIDTALSTGDQIALADELGRIDLTKVAGDIEWTASPVFSRAEQRADFLAIYGMLFFLGSMLSIVFILAAVLIIYYKQICEGYEDRARFAIMRRIGMTARDIHRSINAQLLTVFFLPLIGAGCHLAFAFPMIRRMLLLFGLDNIRLFVLTNLISFAVFALFYALVYRATSGAYFAIVSSAERE